MDEDRLDYVGLKTAWLAERLTCVENGHVAPLTQKQVDGRVRVAFHKEN